MYFYVYRIICTHPDSVERYYYGSRQCQCLPKEDTKYWSSSRGVIQARKRFGTEWFRKKIVSVHTTRAGALAKEIRLHHYFDVKNHPAFFNRANQTSIRFVPGPLSPLSRRKIAEALRGNTHTLGRSHSEETRQKISESMKKKHPRFGRPVSKMTREKISKARERHAPFAGKRHTLETRQKISQALRGKSKKYVHSLETRQKISQAMKAFHAARRAASLAEKTQETQ